MRLIETRLYEGPNLYRLEPVIKLEVAVGRTRPWKGARDADGLVAHAAAAVPAREWPDAVADLVAWVRRLRADHDAACPGPVEVHRATDAGRWIVTWPWTASGRARAIAEGAFDLATRSVSPARRTRLTGTQARLVARWGERIVGARTTSPSWVRDADRRIPVISITGTNGKSTVTRLLTHILLQAGRHVGTTTSDGILVDERLVDAGDWTGPGGAAAILGRDDVDIAVLETARGGLVQRGMGYESNDVSILTNISSDHLDLGGIHTLGQLTEAKATVCRVTRPGGTVVLNADDPHVVAVARRVRGSVTWFSIAPATAALVPLARNRRTGGRAVVVADGELVLWDGPATTPLVRVDEIPVTLGGTARHNVANALAAAAGALALGMTPAQVAAGLRDFRPTPELSPGRLNVFELGGSTVIVDFAHNEAGANVILDVAAALARGRGVTAIIGSAGDRPDESISALAAAAARHTARVLIKEDLRYLRGRERADVLRLLRSGLQAGGKDPAGVPVHETEVEALAAAMDAPLPGGEVIVLFCHEQREEAYALLRARGATSA